MAQIVLTKKWTYKPPLGARINWGDPITQGLMFATFFQEGGGDYTIDLVSGLNGYYQAVSTGDSNRGWKAGATGTARYFSTNTVRQRFDFSKSVTSGYNWSATNYYTILCGVTPTYTTANTDEGYQSALWLATSGSIYTIQFSVGANRVNTYDINNGWLNTGAQVIVAGTYNVVGAVKGPSGRTTYLNGRVNASDTKTATINNGTASYITLMGRTDTVSQGMDGSMEWAMFWNRPLSQAEIQRLTANPYSVLAPRRFWSPFVAAAGTSHFWFGHG